MGAAGRVVALSGGVGGAKLALGLARVLAPEQLMVAGLQHRRRFHASRIGGVA